MKSDRVYLLHVRDHLDNIEAFTRDGRAAFLGDLKTQLAVVRCIEVIGEAVKNPSREFRDARPEVPWQGIAGMRDVLIHAYFSVNLDAVWEVVETHAPELRRNVERFLAQLPDLPPPHPPADSAPSGSGDP